MTDPRNASPGSYWTSGHGAEAGEDSPAAANSGRASVRPNRPGAASPAGWFPPPAGEAAPPVRLREPARSDGAARPATQTQYATQAQYDARAQYDMESRPTSMYRVPWQSARADRARHPARRPQPPAARPHRGSPNDPASRGPGDPASRGTGRDPRATAPDMRWPSLTRQGPVHIPVVGPTEALSDRPGGPGADAPPGVVPGPLDQERPLAHEQQSGWQLALRAWQESGVNWEDTAPEPPADQAPDPYAPEPYSPDLFTPDTYPDDDDTYPDDVGTYPDDAGTYPHDDSTYPDETGTYPDDAGTYPDDVGTFTGDAGTDRDGASAHPDDAGGTYRENAAAAAGDDDYRGDGLYPVSDLDPARPYPSRDGDPGDDLNPVRKYLSRSGDPGADLGPVRHYLARDDYPSGDLGRARQYPARDGDRGDDPGWARQHSARDGDLGDPGRVRQYSARDHHPGDDLSPAHQYSAAPHAAGRYLTDPRPTRPDLPAFPQPADSRLGPGPWPVQQPPQTSRFAPRAAEPEPSAQAGPEVRDPAAPAADPPLPRRVRYAQPSPFAPASPFAPSPALAPPQPPPQPRPLPSPPARGTTRPFAAPLSAPVAPAAPPLGQSDELFRAWQGSVREATGRRAPRPDRQLPPRQLPDRQRPDRQRAAARGRGRGWQVARVGLPAAVIVTVGAGALMILTGRANEMLAQRSTTEPLSAGPGPGAVSSGQVNGTAISTGPTGAGLSGLALAGYPGEHGSVGVTAMWSAGSTTMAVGSADAHPAVWRHAADGSWSLVSAAALGGLAGHLTSVAQGPSGWIAVGSADENGTVEPVVFGSADGVTWTPLPALTGIAGSDAQFVGAAAGPGGYLVVGKLGSGASERAAFWWSGDLKNWASGVGMGTPAHAGAAVAVNDGFVAVGSSADCHTIWLSADGQHWTEHDLSKPSGATTATLQSIAAAPGGRFVAAGFAAGAAGDIPLVVTSADGGAHVTQVVLSAPQGSASVTAVTATSDGFVAVGLAGPANAQRAVEWTSPDGLTWSAATPVSSAGANAITALTNGGTTVTGTTQGTTGPAVLAIPSR
jgi:hypothetical protein